MDARYDRLAIGASQRAAIAAHACAAFPAECCGYLTRTVAVACTNAAADAEHGYEIAGAELLALVRGLTSADPPRAIYHSHTNGRAYFSARDAAIAATTAGPIYAVDHVVVGVTASGVVEVAHFAWSPAARAYVEVARW